MYSQKAKLFSRLKVLRCICASLRSSSLCCIQSFSQARSLLCFARMVLFLSVTNNTKLERLHQAATRAITGCLSFSSIPHLLAEASLSLIRVILTHFTLPYEWALCPPPSFPTSALARLGVKPRHSTRELLGPLTRLCFFLLLQKKFSLLAIPRFSATHHPSPWSLSFSSPCFCSLLQDTALAYLNSLPAHDLD